MTTSCVRPYQHVRPAEVGNGSIRPSCREHNAAGEPCRATPLHDQDLCFWHSPEHATEATEARRLGGLRRRREGALSGAYEIESLASTPDLRRLLEVAAFDALGLENSVARVRAITAIVQVGARLLETGEIEERVAALEATVRSRVTA
jgi:hypothetical protein